MEEYVKLQTARFKIVPVFEISQTDGEPLPELVESLTGDVARYELFMDALVCTFLLGEVGALLGMKMFRHKTKHLKFKLLVPLALVVNAGIIGCYIYFM